MATSIMGETGTISQGQCIPNLSAPLQMFAALSPLPVLLWGACISQPHRPDYKSEQCLYRPSKAAGGKSPSSRFILDWPTSSLVTPVLLRVILMLCVCVCVYVRVSMSPTMLWSCWGQAWTVSWDEETPLKYEAMDQAKLWSVNCTEEHYIESNYIFFQGKSFLVSF